MIHSRQKNEQQEIFQEEIHQEIFKQGYKSVNSVSIAIATCLFFIICRFLFLFFYGSFFSRVPLQL